MIQHRRNSKISERTKPCACNKGDVDIVALQMDTEVSIKSSKEDKASVEKVSVFGKRLDYMVWL
jgi:hypothetical protein